MVVSLVEDRDGCPQLPRKLALQLIDELEVKKKGMNLKEVEEYEQELQWMKQLVRNALVIKPGPWNTLPGSRRKRKKMTCDGFVAHLYAGPDEGFTMGRAWKQAGGSEDDLMEVGVLRGEDHDMLSSTGIYAGLITAVLEDKLKALFGGPNCRTRSVLRHYPIEGVNAVRRWNGEEFGVEEATDEEKKKVMEDDILLWRMVSSSCW